LLKVIDIIAPSAEVGINPEKEEWIKHEIRNFKGTLEFLISKNCNCKDKVNVIYLIDE
jgi:hypothetical protein